MRTVDMTDLEFVRGFMRCCADGVAQGWHERNGGNMTYRMSEADVRAAEPCSRPSGAWTELGVACPDLGGQRFVCTGAGMFLRNVPLSPASTIGIVELSASGDAYRVVWGLEGGVRPTSELASHIMCHDVCARRTASASRVVYHAHTPDIIAMSSLVPLTSRAFSRALWKTMAECAIVFPQGVGVVGWMTPGSRDIARASASLMERFDAVVWAHHGLLAAGESFDAAFGLVHVLEKAAHIYLTARAANGGSDVFANEVRDVDLVDMCRSAGVALAPDFIG